MSQAKAAGGKSLFVGGANGLRARGSRRVSVCGQWRDQGVENVANEGDGWR